MCPCGYKSCPFDYLPDYASGREFVYMSKKDTLSKDLSPGKIVVGKTADMLYDELAKTTWPRPYYMSPAGMSAIPKATKPPGTIMKGDGIALLSESHTSMDLVGKRVWLITDRHGVSDSNPVKGSEYQRAGTVDSRSWDGTYDVRWDGGHLNDNYLPKDLELINEPKKTIMASVSRMMKKLLDPDTQALVEAGFINGDLDLTPEGKLALMEILFDTHKEKLVAAAKERIEEAKKEARTGTV